MKKDIDVCFGKYTGAKCCRGCEYSLSCRFCSEKAEELKPLRTVPLREAESWLKNAADHTSIPGTEEEREELEKRENPPITLLDLASFFKFLLSLDIYTAGVISAVVGSEKHVPSVGELAALHHCTRQGMHKKLLNIIARYPLLSGLLKMTIRHFDRGKKYFSAPALA